MIRRVSLGSGRGENLAGQLTCEEGVTLGGTEMDPDERSEKEIGSGCQSVLSEASTHKSVLGKIVLSIGATSGFLLH